MSKPRCTSLNWLHLIVFAILVPFLGGADDSCTIIVQPPPPSEGEGEGEGEGTCVLDDGRVLDAGDTFEDGCDLCRCRADGEIICQTPPDCGERVCELDDGRVLEPGQTISLDACTTCFCNERGDLICEGDANCCAEGDPGCGGGCFFDGTFRAPGDQFPADDGCNVCECWDGLVVCTEMACPVCEDPNDPDCAICVIEGPNGEATTLHPGETFFDGCNECVCDGNGNLACTDRACLCEPDDLDCGVCILPSGELLPPGGSSFDGCNECFCEDGALFCTERACPCEDPNNPDCGNNFCALDNGEVLLPGESFFDGCNECFCTQTGELICTDAFCGCGPNDPTCNTCALPNGELLPPGGVWFDGCNECACDGAGDLACTDRACPCEAGDPNCGGVCFTDDGNVLQPGETISDGCNTCVCDQDGRLACTAMACPCDPATDPSCGGGGGCLVEGDIMLPPGASWNDGCNECVCGDNGQLFCTDRACGGCVSEDGQHHGDGEVFPADDGCNVCTCLDGLELCTLQACEAP